MEFIKIMFRFQYKIFHLEMGGGGGGGRSTTSLGGRGSMPHSNRDLQLKKNSADNYKLDRLNITLFGTDKIIVRNLRG